MCEIWKLKKKRKKGLSYSVREITKYNLLIFINKKDEKNPHNIKRLFHWHIASGDKSEGKKNRNTRSWTSKGFGYKILTNNI